MLKKQAGNREGTDSVGVAKTSARSEDELGDLSRWHIDPDNKRKLEEREKQRKMDEEFLAHHSKVAPETPVGIPHLPNSKNNFPLSFDEIHIVEAECAAD